VSNITLTHLTTTVTLPADLDWTDEYDWHPVMHAVDYTLTGALVVQTSTRQAGRNITLEGSNSSGWMARSDLDALRALAAIEGAVCTLSMPGRADKQVMFRHQDTAVQAHPVYTPVPPAADDWFYITVKLMEV
jgi:hypothetical protein